MYAIIRAGGKQSKVRPGDLLDVERIRHAGDEVEFTPLFVVGEDGEAIADRAKLDKIKVRAKVLGESMGPKVDVFKYQPKSGYRRRQGHRQRYTTIQVTAIDLPAASAATKTTTAAEKPATAAKKPAAAATRTTTAAKKPAAAATKTATAAKKPAAAATRTTTAAKKPAAAAKKPTAAAKKPAAAKRPTAAAKMPAAAKKEAARKPARRKKPQED